MAIAAIKKVTSAGVTLATSTDNQVATVTGANALTGESNLTFDGTDLIVTGNVGINESAPDTPLHVNGAYSSTEGALKLQSNNNDASKLTFWNQDTPADADSRRWGLANNQSAFGDFQIQRGTSSTGDPTTAVMTFDKDGNVGIGATPSIGILHVQQTANLQGAYLHTTNASFTNNTLQLNATRAASSAYNLLNCLSGNNGDAEFRLRGDGQAYADGSWNGSGADYQEYFESQSGVAAEVGRTVVLDGGQIRYYNAATDSADDIMGVTRPEADNKNSAVVGNLAWNHWTDKYLTDDWGVYEREDITAYQWEVKENETDTGVTHTVHQYSNLWHYSHGDVSEYVPVGSVTIPADAVQTTDNVRKLNPAFDPAQEENYQSREDRDEWWLIGLLGQIQIKAGEPTNPRWIKMKDISANVELWYVR